MYLYTYTFTLRSTFDPNVGDEIRKHIKTPPFIPPPLNEAELAWIFMGAPGPGANIHVRLLYSISLTVLVCFPL